ncbi:MAG: DnaK suppressor protein [Parcubacteria group bacterium LiPW_30]|jgi:RNA polymerase-binding transcription factor DksA|nr:MAG: DnaK suppressor protein [Parcubacteria group bacterium LiPW_30]
MEKNYEKYIQKLTEEKKLLEEEMQSLGRKNPSNPKDWEPVPSVMDASVSDKNEMADLMEDFEEVTATQSELEKRLNEVDAAILRTKNNGYGICSVCGKEIEEKRLDANAAATTCMEHL